MRTRRCTGRQFRYAPLPPVSLVVRFENLSHQTSTVTKSWEKQKKERAMLTKLIVSAYATLIEISLWIFLLISLVAGWQFGDGFVGAIIGLIIGFVVGVMFFGAFLILEDIRKSVKAIEARK
jgi:hypothetical protein